MKKHSVTIAGHRTSLSIEDAFWDELVAIAARDGKSLNSLITLIDKERDLANNLSSALRLFVLAEARMGRAG